MSTLIARAPRPALAAAVFVLAAAAIIARRPDAVTTPQFYAEDGTYWFADAYNRGLAALLLGNQGYLQTLSRLVAVPASHLGLVQAALLFNAVAIAVQAAPAAFVLSRRFDGLAPLRVRVLVGAAYVLVPSTELNATITNAQWHLALLAAMVLAAGAPRSVGWRIFDVAVLVLSGLTGPFSLLLLPGALVLCWRDRPARRWYGLVSAVLASTLVVQAIVFVQTHRGTGAALGARLPDLFFIIADRVVLAASFAEEGHTRAHTEGRPFGIVLAVITVVAAAGVIAVAVRRSPLRLRVFLLICFGITAASLVSPLVPATGPSAWTVFAESNGGARYFLTSEIAWLVCVTIVIAAVPARAFRRAAAAVAVIAFLSGPILSWSYRPFHDKSLAHYDAVLRAAAPGTAVKIPINPNWSMTLIRH